MSQQQHQDEPDLSLPPTAPSVIRWHDEGFDLLPAALYTLVDLTDEELLQVQTECESESWGTGPPDVPGTNVRIAAPRSRFVGEPLRAVFDQHLQLIQQEKPEFNPIYFIVTFNRDWQTKGVLLVTLDDDDFECKTDSFKIRAKDSGLAFVNLQIANMGWSEEKDYFSLNGEGGNEKEDEDDDDNDDHDHDHDSDNGDGDDDEKDENARQEPAKDDQDSDKDTEPTAPDDPGSPSSGPIPPASPPPVGFHIGVYAVVGVDCAALIRKLEPGASTGKAPENYACRLQAILPSSPPSSTSQDTNPIIQTAMTLHPSRCTRNPHLHKLFLLIADTTDPFTNGIVLASLGGEAPSPSSSSSSTSPNPKRQKTSPTRITFPPNATQRLPCTAKSAVQDAICTMVQGLRNWLPPPLEEQPAVVVFRYSSEDGRPAASMEKFAPALDPKWDSRPAGEEVVVSAPSHERVPGRGPKKVAYSLDEAIKRFPRICYDERFRTNLTRRYFTCVDGPDVEKDGVLLVKLDWDGDLSGGLEKMRDMDLRYKAESCRVAIKEAYQKLKNLINGEATWEGTKLD